MVRAKMVSQKRRDHHRTSTVYERLDEFTTRAFRMVDKRGFLLGYMRLLMSCLHCFVA